MPFYWQSDSFVGLFLVTEPLNGLNAASSGRYDSSLGKFKLEASIQLLLPSTFQNTTKTWFCIHLGIYCRMIGFLFDVATKVRARGLMRFLQAC